MVKVLVLEVLNTISHTRSEVLPMLVPENTLPLARIKVAFINSLTRPSVPVHNSDTIHAQSVSRYCIGNRRALQGVGESFFIKLFPRYGGSLGYFLQEGERLTQKRSRAPQ